MGGEAEEGERKADSVRETGEKRDRQGRREGGWRETDERNWGWGWRDRDRQMGGSEGGGGWGVEEERERVLIFSNAQQSVEKGILSG